MSEWQPIETAPKDGTEFQAWVRGSDGAMSWWDPRCRYNEEGAFESYGHIDYDIYGWDSCPFWVPTHWMPQPTAPSNSDQSEAGR